MSTQVLDRPLVSNGYTLSAAPNRLGWLQPTDPGYDNDSFVLQP